MHSLRIKFVYNSEQEYVYSNDEADGATADYEAVKTALSEFRQFKNDRLEIVEITGGAHGKATLKLEHVAAVTLNNLDSAASLMAECASLRGKQEGIADKARAAETALSAVAVGGSRDV